MENRTNGIPSSFLLIPYEKKPLNLIWAEFPEKIYNIVFSTQKKSMMHFSFFG
jgi:hypothetical protein